MEELRSDYQLGAGELIVDARDVDLPGGTTKLAVELGIGHAVIRVPEDACVSSDVRIGAGHAQVLDRTSDGLDVDFEQAASREGAAPRLHLEGDVGIGALEVVRGNDPLPRRGTWDSALDASGPACP